MEFDLSWGYPTDSSGEGTVKPDALDGTAFLYTASNIDPEIVDFRKKRPSCDSVKHSGDKFDDVKRTGHHKITVNLRGLGAFIEKVFFTPSAYNAPSISKFGLRSCAVMWRKFWKPTQSHLIPKRLSCAVCVERAACGGC